MTGCGLLRQRQAPGPAWGSLTKPTGAHANDRIGPVAHQHVSSGPVAPRANTVMALGATGPVFSRLDPAAAALLAVIRRAGRATGWEGGPGPVAWAAARGRGCRGR